MKSKKLTLFALPCLLLASLLLASCSCEEDRTYNVFFSEFYQGKDANDAMVELGSTSSEKYSLEGLKVNFYSGQEITHSYTFNENDVISKDAPIIFANKDASVDLLSTDYIALDDNYLYGSYYVELVDSNNKVIDCLGYKGFDVEFVNNQSLVRLKGKMTPNGKYDPLNYIAVRSGITSYLGNINAPISLEELMSGPRLDETLYGNSPFFENRDGKGGYINVTIQTLGDGDTTYFYYPEDSGLNNSDRVRYLMIDTPEVDHGPGGVDEEAWGNEAKRVNNEKLTNAKGIILQSNKDFTLYETFGRILGYVWYTNEDPNDISSYRLLNFEMVLDGLAEFAESDKYETMYYKDILYYDYLKYANDYAFSLGLKIHGEVDPDFK